MSAGTVYLLHFDQPYKHARHYVGWAARTSSAAWPSMRPGAARGCWPWCARPGSAGSWPGCGRAAGRGSGRSSGRAGTPASARCAASRRGACRATRDGSLSRSRTTDAQKAAAGVMTAAQLAEHTALRYGAVTGKLPRRPERGPLADDPWAVRPAARCPPL